MSRYRIFNGVMPTTALIVPQATGIAAKTMLQVKSVTAMPMRVKAWGVSMDGAAGAAGIQWELVETGTVFATLTTLAAADCMAMNAKAVATAAGTYLAFGTTATGYWSTGGPTEGSITATRVFDSQLVQPTGQYAWEFSLGNEPDIVAVSSLRIRVKAAAGVNAICWVEVEF
jgi:hypothetical protein